MPKLSWLISSSIVLLQVGCNGDGTEDTGANTNTGTSTSTNGDSTAGDSADDGATTNGSMDTSGGSTTDPGTTDGGTTESPTTGADSTAGETGDALTCEGYCATFLTNCVDANDPFYAGDQAVCLEQCSQWPVGMLEDMAGDTLGCRTYHAGAAEADAALHCPHAGPAGGNAEGAPCQDANAPACQAYCETYAANCTGNNDEYTNEQECLETCALWYPGSADDTAGDTVGCRTYHAGAAEADPATHCPHAGPTGGGVCVVAQ